MDLVKTDKKDYDPEERTTLFVQLLQNSANCSLNLEEFDEVIRKCDKALKLQPSASKALYFKSQAQQATKDWEGAQVSLKECIKHMPNDRRLRQDYEKVTAEVKKLKATFTEKIGDFFSGSLYSEKKNVKKTRKRKLYKTLPDFNPDNSQVFLDIAIGYDY